MCRFAVCFRLVDGGYSVAYQGTATLIRLSGALHREHSRPLHTLFGRILMDAYILYHTHTILMIL